MSLFNELKRRNVIRVGIAYIVLAWILLQVGDVVFEALNLEASANTLLLAILAIGFIPVVIFSWAFELTPEGLKRESEVERSASMTAVTAKKLDLMVIVLILVGIGVIAADRLLFPEPVSQAGDVPMVAENSVPEQSASETQTAVNERASAAPASSDRKSIAVLPFTNMSGDPENEYFADGISEELLNVLVRIDDLRVPSRTSSFTFKNSDQKISEIADELDVEHVLEGSVRKAGDQVRITAQLIRAETDEHLWSESYTRKLEDIFAVQDEIAQAIVAALKVSLGAEEAITEHGTANTDAYNHYLKGRFFWHQRTRESFENAERELKQAIELDPGYADAWAALADVYVLQPEYRWADMHTAVEQARAATARALELDPRSARALTTRAYLRFLFDWNYPAAEADFKQAIQLAPDYATAHQWYAEMLGTLRRGEEALEHAEKAYELDPLSPVKPMVVGNVLVSMQRYPESFRWYELALEIAPGWFNALGNLANARMLHGDYVEARELWEAAIVAQGFPKEGGQYLYDVTDALAGKIDKEQAISSVLSSEFAVCNMYDTPSLLASLGAYQKALDVMETCLDEGDAYATAMNFLPPYEPMRDMPRFQALLKRINLGAEE